MSRRGTKRQRQFVCGYAAWVLSAAIGMVALGVFSLTWFYVVSLVGLLAISETTAPRAVRPRWRVRVWGLIVVALLGFAAVLVRHALSLLANGVV